MSLTELLVRYFGVASRWGIGAHIPLITLLLPVIAVTLADRWIRKRS